MAQKFKYDKKHLPFGHSAAINDSEVEEFLKFLKFDFVEILNNTSVVEEFNNKYKLWIERNSLNSCLGLDKYRYSLYSLGTSESFDKFYIKHKNKRFRCFKSEYLYHQLSWRNCFDWLYIEDDIIKEGDAVVISIPFADTGDIHNEMKNVMQRCEEKNIPVLIDCAYYNISREIEFNFDYNCIEVITFSLSKTFPVAHARIGLRLTKEDFDDSLFVYDKSSYTNRIGAYIGLNLIRNFSPQFIVNKYKNKQEELCNFLNVAPSKTILFGISDKDNYKEYNRGGSTNRLGLHKFLNKDISYLKGTINGSKFS